jgi:dihydrofolate reductase
MIRAILACDDGWGIGKDGDLPWPKNAADLKWFKENTLGGVVVMGKSTWDSLPDNSKPLPKRNNVVVTSKEKRELGPYHFMTFETALNSVPQMNGLQNVWIIGGAQLVEGFIDLIDEFYLSRIEGTYDCDTFLPKNLIEEKFRLHVKKENFGVNAEIWVRK